MCCCKAQILRRYMVLCDALKACLIVVKGTAICSSVAKQCEQRGHSNSGKTLIAIEKHNTLFFLIHPVTVILPYQYIVASFYAFVHQIFASLRTQQLAKLGKDLWKMSAKGEAPMSLKRFTGCKHRHPRLQRFCGMADGGWNGNVMTQSVHFCIYLLVPEWPPLRWKWRAVTLRWGRTDQGMATNHIAVYVKSHLPPIPPCHLTDSLRTLPASLNDRCANTTHLTSRLLCRD